MGFPTAHFSVLSPVTAHIYKSWRKVPSAPLWGRGRFWLTAASRIPARSPAEPREPQRLPGAPRAAPLRQPLYRSLADPHLSEFPATGIQTTFSGEGSE